MRFMYVPQVLPLIASFALCLGLSVYGIRYRRVMGAVEFVFAGAVGSLWALFNALELAGADLPTKLVWANLHYLIYGFGPLVWLAMVWRFSEKERRMGLGILVLLGIMPLVTNVFVWLDPQLGLVRRSFSLDATQIPHVIRKEFGPWYWVHYVYSQGLNLVCVAILIRAVARKGSLYRNQSAYILVALGIVYISNLLFALGIGPIKRYDITPTLFCIAAVVFWLGIFRHRLLEIVPIARATVLERMANGMIVVDAAGRILDLNLAARGAFGLGGPSATGKSLAVSVPCLAAALAGIQGRGDPGEGLRPFQREIEAGSAKSSRSYELYASPLLDAAGKLAAWALMITDITDLKLAREKIALQQSELAAAGAREALARELHDNLGQILSFAAIQSDSVMGELRRKNYELAGSQLERLRDIVKEAHTDLRGFVYSLRDKDFEGSSLRDLVELQVRDFLSHCPDVSVDLVPVAGEPPSFSAHEKRQLSQIVKESLNNIAKPRRRDQREHPRQQGAGALRGRHRGQWKGFPRRRDRQGLRPAHHEGAGRAPGRGPDPGRGRGRRRPSARGHTPRLGELA